jgi:hypothetical protein
MHISDFSCLAQYIVMVEALKNLCGISWIKASNTYQNYNVRKFQTDITEKIIAAEKSKAEAVVTPELSAPVEESST